MKLIYTNASPYARKVRITAQETGHGLDFVYDHPTAEDSGVPGINPLGKVPALVLNDGTIIVDSPVICEFLDQHERQPTLIPPMGTDRIRVLTLQAIADGIMDATVCTVLESRRDPSEQSPYWLDRWESAIRRTLPVLENEVLTQDTFHLGMISGVCALHYLDFRFPEKEYLADHPRLTEWLSAYAERPSVAETMPFDGPSR